jgi:hypothetical protein
VSLAPCDETEEAVCRPETIIEMMRGEAQLLYSSDYPYWISISPVEYTTWLISWFLLNPESDRLIRSNKSTLNCTFQVEGAFSDNQPGKPRIRSRLRRGVRARYV